MALLLEINGMDQGAHWWHDREWRIEKSESVETFTAVLCDSDSSASAYRPEAGDIVRLSWDGQLLFGGFVIEVRDERLLGAGGDVGTVTLITCRDFGLLAEEIVITEDIPSGDVLATIDDLVTTYLVPKGVTNIGDTSGGPTVAQIYADHQTLASVISQLCLLAGYRARINGDKEFAAFAPGTLSAPVDLDDTNAWDALEWTKSRAEYASRLIMRTGGSGVVTHSETHTGNGTKTTFLLNVEPQIEREETSPGTVTTTIKAPTEVNENGTVYAIGGGRWTYDAAEHALVKIAGGALTNGHTVTASYPVEFPAWVRVWDAVALESDGTLDRATTIDRLIQVAHILDLAQCAAWGRKELTRRGEQPKQVNLLTGEHGFYPFLEVTLDFPSRLLSGDYLVIGTATTPSVDGTPEYALQLLEGDTQGRSWDAYYRDRQGLASGGGTVVVGSTSIGGGAPTSGGGSGSSSSLPVGATVPFNGDNHNAFTATTSWVNWPNLIPTCLPPGDYVLRTPMHLIASGTLEARLLNQDDGSTVLAETSTTQTGTLTDLNFAYPTDTFTLAVATNVLLQFRRTSSTGKVKLGQATAVRV